MSVKKGPRPTTMKMPPGKSEEEVLASIEKCVNILAPSFVFGYFDLDDVKQQARLFSLECLCRYDNDRPLDGYIYTHVKNRLINLYRDKVRRNDPPCLECHGGAPCCADGGHCKKYSEWVVRNNAKANLVRPQHLETISDEKERRARRESTAEADAQLAELLERVDAGLPIELRADYLRMREGASVPQARREAVMEAVRACLPNADV